MIFSKDPQSVVTVTVTLTIPVARLREMADEADQASGSYSHGGTTDSEIDLADLVLSPVAAALYAAARDHQV